MENLFLQFDVPKRGDAARASEAQHGSAGGRFPCGTCQQCCTNKANYLIEVLFAGGKTAVTPPLCDCEESPATVHCGKCNVATIAMLKEAGVAVEGSTFKGARLQCT